MNTKLHAVTDTKGLTKRLHLSVGQVSEYTGATALLDKLPTQTGFLRIEATVQTGLENS